MKRAVKTDIPKHGRPFEWGIVADGTLYTAAAPMKADGTPETGNIRKQITLALSNLAKVLKSAGGTMADGQLYIDIVTNPQAPYAQFVLKELPTPEPGTAALLLIGLLAISRRRG